MSYASLQDMIDRFGDRELIQLTDRTNRPASVIDQTVVGRALADADALIDGYVGKVHALPLAAVPPALVKTAADIARFYLHSKPEKDGAVYLAFRDAKSWLADVSRGTVQLDVGGVAPPAPAGGTIQASQPSRVFTRDSLAGS